MSYLCLLTGTKVSDWERVGLHTTALTTLALTSENHGIASLPTIDELLRLLALNPLLQNVTLHHKNKIHFQGLSSDQKRKSGQSFMPFLEHLKVTGPLAGTFKVLQTEPKWVKVMLISHPRLSLSVASGLLMENIDIFLIHYTI